MGISFSYSNLKPKNNKKSPHQRAGQLLTTEYSCPSMLCQGKEGIKMSDYSQSRSFNLGIAQDTSVEAAMIYDDLVYAQKVFGKGYFFRSYDQMLKRFPFMSEQTIRRHVKLLADGGWLSTKIKKVNGRPTCHYQIERFLSAKMEETMETTKLADSINIETTKETTSRSELEKNLLVLVNKVLGREFRVLPERGVKKTLDNFSLVEIEQALTALARDNWHISKLKELKLDYFIRSTTIDKFLAIAKKNGIVAADEGVEDPIVKAAGDTFPARWPKGKPEWSEDDDENRYFRGVKIDHTNKGEIMKIEEARRGA